jgi:hypothetical protein
MNGLLEASVPDDRQRQPELLFVDQVRDALQLPFGRQRAE